MNVEIFKKTVTVGRTTEGKINLTLTIRNCPGPKESIDHGRMDWYHELTISGEICYKNGRLASCGQINRTIRETIADLKPTKGVMMDRADLERILDIWDRWHLNGMNASCAHQHNTDAPCPVTGYKHGSKWLVEPLPRDVTYTAMRIFNKYVEV